MKDSETFARLNPHHGIEPKTNPDDLSEIYRRAIQEPTEPTVKMMHRLYLDGVIGTKEFRSWLAKMSPTFGEVRDASVDNTIDESAREEYEIARELRRQRNEALRLDNLSETQG